MTAHVAGRALHQRGLAMSPWIAAAALGISKLQEKRQKDEARRQALADLYQQRAQALGAPTTHLNAQRAANEISEIEGPNYFGALSDEEEKRRRAGQGDMGASDYAMFAMR